MATTLGNGNGITNANCIPTPKGTSSGKGTGTATVTATAAAEMGVGVDVVTSSQQIQEMELKVSTELFNLIKRNHNEMENVIISPLLLESMLALLYLGSDGATAQQLKNILQLKRFNESNMKMANYYAAHLQMATRESSDTRLELSQIILLHGQYQMAEEFQRIAKKYFHTNAKTSTAASTLSTLSTTATTNTSQIPLTGTGTGTPPVTTHNVQNIESLQNMKNMENFHSQINDSLAKISIRPFNANSLTKDSATSSTSIPQPTSSQLVTSAGLKTATVDEKEPNGNPSPPPATTATSILSGTCSQGNGSTDVSHDGGNVVDAGDVVVALAANLKNKWFLPFSAYRTGLYDFHSFSNSKINPNTKPASDSNGCSESLEVISVPMLFDDDMFVKFGEFRDLDARAIELPFECEDDNELSMLIVLPNQKESNSLPDLLEKLKAVDFNALTDSMQVESVQVLIPKIAVEFECCLKSYLEKLGLLELFSKNANLQNLLSAKSSKPIWVANILQKFKLVVNESGSEESKSQVYKPLALSNAFTSKKKFFRADHPFYFAIRNPYVTYFMGCITSLK